MYDVMLFGVQMIMMMTARMMRKIMLINFGIKLYH